MLLPGRPWPVCQQHPGLTTKTLSVVPFWNGNSPCIGTSTFSSFGNTFNAYRSSGVYTSPVFDAGQSVTWDSIDWSGNFPAGTGVTYQIAVGDPTVGWTYVGYDGTTGTVFSSSHMSFNTPPSGRYCSWQATLTGTGSNTPNLDRVDVFYAGTNTASSYTYSYDGASNMTGKITEVLGSTTVTETRTVNNLNQITANSVVGATTTNWTYSYDLSGNMTQRVNTTLSETTSYQWDEDNRLTQVTLPSSAVISYTYDTLGRMLTRTDSAGTTAFVWDGMNCVQETDHSGNVTRYYVPGQRRGTGPLMSFDRTVSSVTTTYQVHADALGSVRKVSDSSGTVQATYDYDAWGNQLASTSDSIPNGGLQYRFVGALGVRWEAATGLYYMGQRWYDPSLQRFVQLEPIRYKRNVGGGYGYANNVPNSHKDPSGAGIKNNLGVTNAQIQEKLSNVSLCNSLFKDIAAAPTMWSLSFGPGGSSELGYADNKDPVHPTIVINESIQADINTWAPVLCHELFHAWVDQMQTCPKVSKRPDTTSEEQAAHDLEIALHEALTPGAPYPVNNAFFQKYKGMTPDQRHDYLQYGDWNNGNTYAGLPPNVMNDSGPDDIWKWAQANHIVIGNGAQCP